MHTLYDRIDVDEDYLTYAITLLEHCGLPVRHIVPNAGDGYMVFFKQSLFEHPKPLAVFYGDSCDAVSAYAVRAGFPTKKQCLSISIHGNEKYIGLYEAKENVIKQK